MNIVERGRAFVKRLRELANRTAWDWRRCPKCGDTDTVRYGTYTVHPWFLDGRREVRIQRHKCNRCSLRGKTFTYSEQSALLVRGSWYAREVHRFAIDQWVHGRGSLRRVVEFVRSLLGRQERWRIWRPLDEEPTEEGRCHPSGRAPSGRGLGASTLHRWLDGMGQEAERGVEKQLEGVSSSGQVSTDGLWSKLRGGTKRVVLALVDSVTGLIWPPVVVEGEESPKSWAGLFQRAKGAGLNLKGLRGVASDGASGLLGYLNRKLVWVNHQWCAFHLWRSLAGELARRASEAAAGLGREAAKAVREEARKELVSLVHGVVDAKSEAGAQAALAKLAAHRLGAGSARLIEGHLDELLVYLLRYNRGLIRVAPEWVWRDFRLRPSRGRNHGSDPRLERAALVWAIYSNFTPAQWRCERKRKYRRPGQSSLELAGVPPGEISYLDALGV